VRATAFEMEWAPMKRFGLAISLLVTGCVLVGTNPHHTSVTRRASYDFGCAEEQVSIRDVGGNAYEARGCGRQQIYNCAESSSTCVPERGQLPPASPPPPAPVTAAPTGAH
jgi:hypothetical protein